jgi:hypothetical protein
LLFIIPIILIGAFLIGLTINNIGDLGNIIMDIVGWGFILGAGLIGRNKKKEKNQSS